MRVRKLLAASIAIFAAIAFAQPAAADAIRDREYWLADYGFTKAWKITKGAGTKVAVIDTGIDASHPDLQESVSMGIDVSGLGSEDGLSPIGENFFHGTLVASLLAGRGHDKNSGVIGTAPEATLLSASMAFGADAPDTDEQVAKAIRWSVDQGAKVINLSLTRNSADWPISWDNAFQYAFDHDVVVVAAAGNRASGTEQVGAPATIPGVLVVAGVDRNANASTQASTEGLTIAVAAPATDLVGAYPGGDYKIWSGTSGAAPLVSGLVALVRAEYPQLDANNVINRIIKTATKIDGQEYSTKYGFGLINPVAALTAKVPTVSQNPLGSLTEWVELYRAEAQVPAPAELSVGEGQIVANDPGGIDSTQWVPIAVYSVFGTLALISVFRRLRRNK